MFCDNLLKSQIFNAQDQDKNGIPTPKIEEIPKGISATLEAYSDGSNNSDTKVYWDFVFDLKENVTFFEDRPNIVLQYTTMDPEDESKWFETGEASAIRVRSTIQPVYNDYGLSGSCRADATLVVYFRYLDKEKKQQART